jgi:hypothetical protein
LYDHCRTLRTIVGVGAAVVVVLIDVVVVVVVL